MSVSLPFWFLMMSIGMGFTIAGSTLIAQYVGARNRVMVDHVAGQTLLTVVAVSAVLGLIGFLSRLSAGADGSGARPSIAARSASCGCSSSALPLAFTFFCFQSQMRGMGQVTVPLYLTAGTVFINFVLDPIFIFWLGWGVTGAALATVISQSIAAAAAILILIRGRYGIQLKIRGLKPDFAFIRRAFNLGYPAAIEGSAARPGRDGDDVPDHQLRHGDDRGLWRRRQCAAIRGDPGGWASPWRPRRWSARISAQATSSARKRWRGWRR